VENSAGILRNSLWSAVQIADILISHHGNDQLSHSDFTAVTGVNQLEPVLIPNGSTVTATHFATAGLLVWQPWAPLVVTKSELENHHLFQVNELSHSQ